MKLHLEENLTQKDIEILIRYAKLTPTVKRLATMIQSIDSSVRCNTEDGETWIQAADIYYVESVDKKTFVYTEDAVYRSSHRLYQLIEELDQAGFVQISKSCLLNINVTDSIHTMINSRMEAALKNGERVGVSRKYIPAIKAKLQER